MALNIKDPETEALAAEVAHLSGDTKTGAVRSALRTRRDELRRRGAAGDRAERLRRALETEIWPLLPPGDRGPITKAEREAILGYGPDGA